MYSISVFTEQVKTRIGMVRAAPMLASLSPDLALAQIAAAK